VGSTISTTCSNADRGELAGGLDETTREGPVQGLSVGDAATGDGSTVATRSNTGGGGLTGGSGDIT